MQLAPKKCLTRLLITLRDFTEETYILDFYYGILPITRRIGHLVKRFGTPKPNCIWLLFLVGWCWSELESWALLLSCRPRTAPGVFIRCWQGLFRLRYSAGPERFYAAGWAPLALLNLARGTLSYHCNSDYLLAPV